MTQADQLKVIKAGFIIIRSDEHNLIIKMKNKDHLHWTTIFSGFKSKAALHRKMKEILELPKYIED